ncbi:MAG: cell division protein FtsZ [Candidatus Thermoplasmatota archaeon]|jgi:cell division protein FtsZ|nr:cell division protein FtsZ [Candidatus Thermoplasmatota archaeon]MDP7264922.1 cell division protein FtsZ [Candidatus Thermoplasmatota archaeon]
MTRSLARDILTRKTSEVKKAPSPSPVQPKTIIEQTGAGISDSELDDIAKKLKPQIKIVGCGGAGSNTINRCVDAKIYGAELYALNTDAQHLLHIKSPHKLLIGKRTTRGLGAGSQPQIGEHAAAEEEDEIRQILTGAEMVFITCGMGGGTGTGTSPYVAKLAAEMGILTLAIVTFPFSAEGLVRRQNAQWGFEKLKEVVDTVIVIQNDKLLKIVPRMPLNAAFQVADEILMQSIKSITEIITKTGLVNLDFNDLRSILRGGGVAMIGLGKSDSDERVNEAVEEALGSPLLDLDISDVGGALVNVVGGEDMTVSEAEKVVDLISEKINPQAQIIWGARIDRQLDRTIEVMVVLTGVISKHAGGKGQSLRPLKELGLDFIR